MDSLTWDVKIQRFLDNLNEKGRYMVIYFLLQPQTEEQRKFAMDYILKLVEEFNQLYPEYWI